ncbi:hypothetical protein CupriaWKF_15030 [Cupriavidus sp. WKF15]|uniref:hypothetical protein n=1 Tax=Cupriavidus sp. WKF15 TaxID=3032282 RepID=UPI0023E2A2CE|nr:hypothetical protein [Cupriavidus sp. WKF15]WER45592.1 hypothetical protein CupriaWKF_15030 [Cupriavidus sp. WKF15]
MNQKIEKLLKLAALEFGVFLAQMAVFFLVAVFLSHFLESRELLNAYTEAKLGNHLLAEFWFTLLGVVVMLGLLSLIAGIAHTNALGRLSSEVLQEVPRTIYFFGSTAAGTASAWAVHEWAYGTSSAAIEALRAAAIFASGAFVAGFILKALLSSTKSGDRHA